MFLFDTVITPESGHTRSFSKIHEMGPIQSLSRADFPTPCAAFKGVCDVIGPVRTDTSDGEGHQSAKASQKEISRTPNPPFIHGPGVELRDMGGDLSGVEKSFSGTARHSSVAFFCGAFPSVFRGSANGDTRNRS